MDGFDYLLLAQLSFVASLVCFASPVFGWIRHGNWHAPGWTIRALLRARRMNSEIPANAAGPAWDLAERLEHADGLGRYSIVWIFLGLSLALLLAAGLEATSLDSRILASVGLTNTDASHF
jgi:hypothetical protein